MRTSPFTSVSSRAVRSAVLSSVVAIALLGARVAHADVALPDEDAATDSGVVVGTTDGGVADASSDASAKDASVTDSGIAEFGDHGGGGAYSECSSGPGVTRLSAPWIVAMGVAFAFRKRSRR